MITIFFKNRALTISQEMIYEWRIFTHRICCLNSMVAAILMTTFTAGLYLSCTIATWICFNYNNGTIVEYQALLFCMQSAICFILFIACRGLYPALVLICFGIQVMINFACAIMEIWSLKEYLSVDSVFPYQEHKIIDAMIDDSGY
ncbi:hypothetical protein PRIPAC_89248 [Pristionchus pacificus]|uniref:Uncharacterized protein n=1 Tax=Pristionchus pacificus TaxID=54126 RepID=A0A2A6CX56_PRIPA|nr:hypothetical protein PRIPAC_89248 [Pristionchus pacificus]|eukprot:PDM82611.1 hypothetical protein PRIPAC_37004 [Pristionchus pacificus]